MSVHLNWLAVQEPDATALLDRAGYAVAGMASDELNTPVAGAVLPGGWLVIASWDMGLDLERLLPTASAQGLALGGEMDERVMVSRLRAFRHGAPVWTVTHDPEKDLDGVLIDGEPPGLLKEVQAEVAAEQADGSDEVDYAFDAPVRLGQRLSGYDPESPLPVEWMILEPAGRKPRPALEFRLGAAFRSELLPQLEASGWRLAAADPEFRGRAWDVTRVVGGRRQQLMFSWREDRAGPSFETQFLVFDGEAWDSSHLVRGDVREVRTRAREGGGLWGRLFGRGKDAERASSEPEDPLARLVERVREDLAAVERFLASGDPEARIEVRFGSADRLRPA